MAVSRGVGADGGEFFYQSGSGRMMAAKVHTRRRFENDPPQAFRNRFRRDGFLMK
jgi:hypothetical protein